MHHAARKRDRSKRRLTIAAKVQHAARCRDRAAGRKPVIPASKHQRTIAHRCPTRVRVHPAQRQCPSAVFHQAQRASERRAHRPRLRHVCGSDRDHGAVLYHAARKRERSHRRLRITAKVQDAARCGNGATGRKTIVPTGKHQRTVAHRCPTRVSVHPTQRQRPSSILYQALRPSEHRAHRSRLRHIRCSSGRQSSILHDAARERERSQRRLTIAAQVQNAARRCNRAAGRKTVIPTGEHQRAAVHRSPACVRVHPAQRQRPNSVLYQALRPVQHSTHRPALCHKRRSRRGERAVLHPPARKRDGSQRRLRIAAKIQHAATRRDRPARRQPIAAAAQQQRTCAHRRPTRVRVRRRQRRRACPALHQPLRARKHRTHRSALRHIRRRSRDKGPVLHHASAESHRPRRTLTIQPQIQHTARRGYRTGQIEAVASTS